MTYPFNPADDFVLFDGIESITYHTRVPIGGVVVDTLVGDTTYSLTGKTIVRVECWGPGGPPDIDTGHGGGGGGYARGTPTNNPASLVVVVGTPGGLPTKVSWDGGAGYVQGSSGVGGSSGGAGGTGVTAGSVINTQAYTGGSGAPANLISGTNGGGGGGAGSGGNGGDAPDDGSGGVGGTPDGGAGGPGDDDGLTDSSGATPGGGAGGDAAVPFGTGGAGQVKITYRAAAETFTPTTPVDSLWHRPDFVEPELSGETVAAVHIRRDELGTAPKPRDYITRASDGTDWEVTGVNLRSFESRDVLLVKKRR